MKDYYENKIAHLKEQIKELNWKIGQCNIAIKNNQKQLQDLEDDERIYGREIVLKTWCNFDAKIENLHKDIEYYHSKIRSFRREITTLEEEIENVQRQQRNQYKTKCSADAGYDDVSIRFIIERNGFIGGTRL